MSLNIPSTVEDPFFRYKMPALVAKVEGNGNGIKTVISNMSEIARCLARPPSYPTKYFGIELGTQSIMDEKNDRYIINGAHEAEDLQRLLDGFITKFVCCPKCNLPETVLTVSGSKKKKTIDEKCICCGHSTTLKFAHRLINFIINHPPPELLATKKGADQSRKDANQTAEDDDTLGDVEAPNMPVDDDGEWVNDMSDEALRRREQEELSGAAMRLVMTTNNDLPEAERAKLFRTFLKKQKEDDTVTAQSVLTKAEELDLGEEVVFALADTLLSDDNVPAMLQKYKDVVVAFTKESKKLQRRLLNALEIVIKEHDISLDGKVLNILNALYQLDLVEEDSIRTWHGKASKKYVPKPFSKKIREATAPFIEWLDQSDEEEDDEDEDDDDEDDDDAQADDGDVTFAAPEDVPEGGDGDDDGANEDDLDIDDI